MGLPAWYIQDTMNKERRPMPEDYRKLIAAAVRDQREVLGLTQAGFAKALSEGLPKDIKKQHISHWENGRSVPDLWLMAAVRGNFIPGIDWEHRMADLIIETLLLMESESGKDQAGSSDS
jgi:DNA-binding transcriptional regulator YiaG